jgi:hypothetical protein
LARGVRFQALFAPLSAVGTALDWSRAGLRLGEAGPIAIEQGEMAWQTQIG